jgi:hypothetical protein
LGLKAAVSCILAAELIPTKQTEAFGRGLGKEGANAEDGDIEHDGGEYVPHGHEAGAKQLRRSEGLLGGGLVDLGLGVGDGRLDGGCAGAARAGRVAHVDDADSESERVSESESESEEEKSGRVVLCVVLTALFQISDLNSQLVAGPDHRSALGDINILAFELKSNSLVN